MDLITELAGVWPYIVGSLTLLLDVLASGHAVLHKRDSRAAVLWVGFIWLAPVMGGVLYWLLGVNRIRRRASSLRPQRPSPAPPSSAELDGSARKTFEEQAGHLLGLARMGDGVIQRPLVSGNKFLPLMNGDAAFPAMLEGIAAATRSVSLATYIFDRGQAGEDFVRALAEATRRGVAVRVLIDDTGARYSWPTIVADLQRAGVRVARFLPTLKPFRIMAINMRSHRKILVVDGQLAFTGGMNIRDGHLLKINPSRPVQDIHFRVEGPVVSQLQEVFANDWMFAAQEHLTGDQWFPELAPCGSVFARGIPDGPDLDFEKLRWTILGALSLAKSSVRIVTPYFLPDPALISALNVVAMRGVRVEIILPSKNNLPFVHWATRAILWQVLSQGCRVWLTPPPFDHSKLMEVDRQWVLLGSANWDPRSLRLNFELNVECYSSEFAASVSAIIDAKLLGSRQITHQELDARSLPIKLRDGIARLFTPFL